MGTETVYTYQAPEVLDLLRDGKTYVADFSRGKLRDNGSYEELSRILGISNCPVFGGLSENETFQMAASSGIEVGDKKLLKLEVPANEVHKMGYYDWSDYIYYWVDHQEKDSITKEQAEEALKSCHPSNRPCQVVIDRIEPGWLQDDGLKEDIEASAITNKWDRTKGKLEADLRNYFSNNPDITNWSIDQPLSSLRVSTVWFDDGPLFSFVWKNAIRVETYCSRDGVVYLDNDWLTSASTAAELESHGIMTDDDLTNALEDVDDPWGENYDAISTFISVVDENGQDIGDDIYVSDFTEDFTEYDPISLRLVKKIPTRLIREFLKAVKDGDVELDEEAEARLVNLGLLKGRSATVDEDISPVANNFLPEQAATEDKLRNNPNITSYKICQPIDSDRADAIWYDNSDILWFVWKGAIGVEIYGDKDGRVYFSEGEDDCAYDANDLEDRGIFTDAELYDATRDYDDAWENFYPDIGVTLRVLDADGKPIGLSVSGYEIPSFEYIHEMYASVVDYVIEEVLPEGILAFGDEQSVNRLQELGLLDRADERAHGNVNEDLEADEMSADFDPDSDNGQLQAYLERRLRDNPDITDWSIEQKVDSKRTNAIWFYNHPIFSFVWKNAIRIEVTGNCDGTVLLGDGEDEWACDAGDLQNHGIYTDDQLDEATADVENAWEGLYDDIDIYVEILNASGHEMGYNLIQDVDYDYDFVHNICQETIEYITSDMLKELLSYASNLDEDEYGRLVELGLVEPRPEVKESKKRDPEDIKVGDPNAKAMWGRTRSQVFAPKKGKGSFKRRPKHDDIELDEAKNKGRRNELRKRAAKHKRTDKKGAMGWFMHPNAGNVELNVQHFNHVSTGTGESTISAPAGLGEDIKPEAEDRYHFVFQRSNEFSRPDFYHDRDDGHRVDFWRHEIPELAYVVKRDSFAKDRILRMGKNAKVFKGVSEFFKNHPYAKSCIVRAYDNAKLRYRYGLPLASAEVNTYKVLLSEALRESSQVDYYVVSDGKNPRNSTVFSSEGKDDALAYAKSLQGYWEVLHYVNGVPETIWSSNMLEDLDTEAVTVSDDPSIVRFGAYPREAFMVRASWGRGYPYFRCPDDSVVIQKEWYKNGEYVLCPKAKEAVDAFFEKNPRNGYCVLRGFGSSGHPVNIKNPNHRWGIKAEGIDEGVEKHDTLNPKLWDEANHLKTEVREKVLEIVKEFTDSLERDGIKFKVDDIVLVGSNCSYNYNDKSDLDIHIRMDTDSLECPDDLYPLLYSAYRSLFNGKMDIDFYGIPVEIFVETSDTVQMNDEDADMSFDNSLEESSECSMLDERVGKNPHPNTQAPDFIEECKELAKNPGEVIGILRKYNMISSEPSVDCPSYILEDGSFVTVDLDTKYNVSSRAAGMQRLGVTYHEMIDDLLHQEGVLKHVSNDRESGSYVMHYMNAIRLNPRSVETYIELNAGREPTGAQYDSLGKFIDVFEQKCASVDIITSDGKYFIKADFSDPESDTRKTIAKIKNYYSSGILKEARTQTAVKSNGVYSVLNDDWIKEPVAADIPDIDQEAFEKELEKWTERYNEVMRGQEMPSEEDADAVLEKVSKKVHYVYVGPIRRFGRTMKSHAVLHTMAVSDRQAYNSLLYKAAKEIGYDRSMYAQVEIDPERISEYDDEGTISEPRCERCGSRLTDGGECPHCDLGDESYLEESYDYEGKIDEISEFIEDLYELRKTSIAEEGEYGIGNLVFKEMRNLGYLDNLKDLKNLLKSKKLSLA